MRFAIFLLGFVLISGCATERQLVSPDAQIREIEARRLLLGHQQRLLQAALEREKPITIDFVRKDIHVIEHYLALRRGENRAVYADASGPTTHDNSYNPELRRMGMRISSDGQPKRIAGDGEIPATWEDLRRAQGFGR